MTLNVKINNEEIEYIHRYSGIPLRSAPYILKYLLQFGHEPGVEYIENIILKK
jgi:hypothetical protein